MARVVVDEERALPPATERASYRIWTHDKLRYNDTDRQGHVNNAVFATFCETGRVAFLYDKSLALAAPGCNFVVARLAIDFRAELYFPGTVDIGTRVLKIGRSSFVVGQGVFKGDLCVATAESVGVQMNDETRKSEPLTPAMVAWLRERMDA
jgi:acyl-CoA thioester hydrolase